MEKSTQFKKRIVKSTLIFLGTMLGFTILSKTIYTYLLPVVQIEKVKQGTVETKFITEGRIGLNTTLIKVQKVVVKAPISGAISTALIEEGSKVEEGDPLFTIKRSYIQSERVQTNLEQTELYIEQKSLARQKQELLRKKAKSEMELAAKKEARIKAEKSYVLTSIEGEIQDQEKLTALNEELYNEGLLAKGDYLTAKKKLDLLKIQQKEEEKEAVEAADKEIKILEDIREEKVSQLETLNEKIALNEEKLTLKEIGESEEIITSPISGYIYELSAAKGTSMAVGEQLAVIVPRDIPCQLTFEITDKQAEKVKVGQEINWLLNNNSEKARVIKKGSNEESDNVVISCEIQDEILKSLELDYKDYKNVVVEIINVSSPYECVVTNSAIIKEGADAYIYAVEETSGTFETTYTVHKRRIVVLKSGDFTSAIEGTVSRNEQVIKTSSKPLKDGIEVAKN